MNKSILIKEWKNKIFRVKDKNFDNLALELFNFQYHHNTLYKKYVKSLNIDIGDINTASKIPFLPIELFKYHKVVTTNFAPQVIFESSGTTGTFKSKHYLKSIHLYRENFNKIFERYYGSPKKYCILGLLPSYLERNNSSLVMMVNELIKKSESRNSGFYLNEHEKLHQTILLNEHSHQPTLLIGVTFGLLDFAEQFKMHLKYTSIIETGGMKGHRKEMIRNEVHDILKMRFGVKYIHSEYGMTEMLSQAYSKKDGLFTCPPWMKVFIRNYDDPLSIEVLNKNKKNASGIINIIDLANIFSCAFIATEDIGTLHHNGYFEVQGRMDNSDTRGCSLLIYNQ